MGEINSIADLLADVDLVNKIPIVPSLLDVVCKTTGMGFAAIARVTENKWIACSVRDDIFFGLEPGGELQIETTICHEIRQNHQLVVIEHVDQDEGYKRHPTPLLYGFQSYISVPIMRRDGSFFGTLCAIDPKPAKIKNKETIDMFTLFAELVSFHLEGLEKIARSEVRLAEARKNAELREQFIAILGHDLRNPLNSVMMGAELLSVFPLDDETMTVIKTIQNSSYRMSGLIENILDFARGRLGEGITLDKQATATLNEVLSEIIDELQAISPNQVFETQFELTEPVYCDSNRIGQLFSNLLGNAVTHGTPGMPILIHASSNKSHFTLAITNFAEQIPTEQITRLFQPFYRGGDVSGKKGLGLGLFIASEIARAHGGTINVTSTRETTCFELVIPNG